IGIVPSYELTRLDLDILPGTGIASRGPVRSILLISRCPPGRIRTLAADTSSRTSVQLARVVLSRRFGAAPVIVPYAPDLDAMLDAADAALIIGDPALRIEPKALPYHAYDLGTEWTAMTGQTMVFAVWAARKGIVTPELCQAFIESCRFGMNHLEDIVAAEATRRGFPPAMVRDYLTNNVQLELGPDDYEGMREFLKLAAEQPVQQASAR